MKPFKEQCWAIAANCLAHTRLGNWVVSYAQRTPYKHIIKDKKLYMGRWWVFNRYDQNGKRYKCLPSLRVHLIAGPDKTRHLHDHPWDARTFVLNGGYTEVVLMPDGSLKEYKRRKGYTGKIGYGKYHTITAVEPNTYTLFVTYRHRGEWGFLVNNRKIPHYMYQDAGELA